MDQFIDLVDTQALATRAAEFIPSLVAATLILLLFMVALFATTRPLRRLLIASGLHETLVRMLVDNVYRYCVFGFGVVMAADQLGINVAAALAGIGVVGIAIGFAAQDTLSNIIAGFLIFMDKPFQVGDWVEVASEAGQVSEITMRTTRIRTRDNTHVVIPNKKIIDEVLVNHSQHGATRVVATVGIAYKESIPAARKVLVQAMESVPGLLKDPAPSIVVNELGGSSVDLQVRVWIDEADQQEPVTDAVIEASKLALDAAGIEIPYPHLQLFVDDVREPAWKALARARQPSSSVS